MLKKHCQENGLVLISIIFWRLLSTFVDFSKSTHTNFLLILIEAYGLKSVPVPNLKMIEFLKHTKQAFKYSINIQRAIFFGALKEKHKFNLQLVLPYCGPFFFCQEGFHPSEIFSVPNPSISIWSKITENIFLQRASWL